MDSNGSSFSGPSPKLSSLGWTLLSELPSRKKALMNNSGFSPLSLPPRQTHFLSSREAGEGTSWVVVSLPSPPPLSSRLCGHFNISDGTHFAGRPSTYFFRYRICQLSVFFTRYRSCLRSKSKALCILQLGNPIPLPRENNGSSPFPPAFYSPTFFLLSHFHRVTLPPPPSVYIAGITCQ